MSGWQVALIIALVLGFIVSNLMLLKYSARFDLKRKLNQSIGREAGQDKPSADSPDKPER